jgi:polyhydroxyalkanoate synthesis regulator phasin
MSEMAERAQIIGQEAGARISSAMKEAISTAAGIAGFAVESARDLVQYMVRRGQMSQEEADKLIREAEEAHRRKTPRAPAKLPPDRSAPKELPRETVQREPEKGVAKAEARRSSGSVAAVKAEKPEKSARAEKVEKKSTKAPVAKKGAAKPPAAKKRR